MTATATRPRRKRNLPIDATAGGYVAPPARDGDGPPRIDPDRLGRRFLRNWELGRLEVAAMRSEAWWVQFLAREKVPADTALPIVAMLIDWVLIEGIVRLNDPESHRVEGGDEPTVDAESEGLSVHPLPGGRERQLPAIHPGCQRFMMVGDHGCTGLRRYGDRLCPKCSRDYLKLHRPAA